MILLIAIYLVGQNGELEGKVTRSYSSMQACVRAKQELHKVHNVSNAVCVEVKK